MGDLIPVDTSFLFEYIRLSKKALMLIDKELAVLYCSNEATRLVDRFCQLNVQPGHSFFYHSSPFEAEVYRLLQQSFETCLPASSQFPGGEYGSVNTLELRVYNLARTKSDEPLVFLELTESPVFDLTFSNEVKHVGNVLNMLGDYVWSHNFLLNETWFSGDFNFFIGYATGELKSAEMPAVWWQCTHPEDRHLLLESDLLYKKGGQTGHSLEYRIIDRNGKERWVLDKGTVVQWQQNKLPAVIIGTHTDISELKRLQQEMIKLKKQRDNELVFASFSTAEDDRKFITAFLHENINQLLSAAHAKLDSGINNSFNSVNSEVQHILQQTIEEIKEVCNQIDPSALEMFELDEVLNDVVNFIQTRVRKKIGLLYHDTRLLKRKHYQEELTVVRLFQDFLRYCTGSACANEILAEVNYDDRLLKVSLQFTDPSFEKEQYQNRQNVKMLVGRCKYFNGIFELDKSSVDRVQLLVELRLDDGNFPAAE